jgi:hypothetical protein
LKNSQAKKYTVQTIMGSEFAKAIESLLSKK